MAYFDSHWILFIGLPHTTIEGTDNSLSSFDIVFYSSLSSKIICLSLFVTYLCHNPKKDKQIEQYLVDRTGIQSDLHKERSFSIRYQRKCSTEPLDPAQLDLARQHRLVEIQMFIFLRKLVISIVCLILISFFVHSTTNIHSFEQVQHLKSYLTDSRNQHMNFYQVRSFHIISSSLLEFL